MKCSEQSVISLLYAMLLSMVSATCSKKTFHVRHGRMNTVTPFYALSSMLTLAKCERTCRQLLGCTAFNMRWAAQQGGLGNCDFFKAKVSALTEDSGISYYSSCPDGMTYNPDLESCYTRKNGRLAWQDAENYCQTFHPDGHIIEINSEREQSFLKTVMDDNRGWLGARRQTGTWDLHWVRTGRRLEDEPYVLIEHGEPNLSGDCARATSDAYEWGDTDCMNVLKFICEVTNF